VGGGTTGSSPRRSQCPPRRPPGRARRARRVAA
jgi:hypothetical protein